MPVELWPVEVVIEYLNMLLGNDGMWICEDLLCSSKQFPCFFGLKNLFEREVCV